MTAQSIEPNQKPTCDVKSASSSVRSRWVAFGRRAAFTLRLWICLLVHVSLPVCLIISNLLCQKLPLFSPRFTISLWMIFNSQVNPTVPCHEYACLFFGIYSFNGLERDVISRISPLPWFGRCFEVFACVCVCVLVASLAGVSSVWETAK